MKRFVICITVVSFLLMAAPSFAVDLTGMFGVGAFAGYGMGFGDAFEDVESEFYTMESSLQFNFGGTARYNFNPNMGVRAAVEYQMWKMESTVKSGAPAGMLESDETENWIGITADFAYTLMPEGNTMPYFIVGPGIYIPSAEGSDSKLGFNGGVGVLHFFSPTMALDAGAKFTMIPSAYDEIKEGSMTGETESKSITAAQIWVGFSYFFGGEM